MIEPPRERHRAPRPAGQPRSQAELDRRGIASMSSCHCLVGRNGKTKVQREKIVRPWFWPDANGLCMVVRYGARPLELAKGKRALAVPNVDTLPDVIGTVIAAVKSGELDGAMDAAIAVNKAKLGKA